PHLEYIYLVPRSQPFPVLISYPFEMKGLVLHELPFLIHVRSNVRNIHHNLFLLYNPLSMRRLLYRSYLVLFCLCIGVLFRDLYRKLVFVMIYYFCLIVNCLCFGSCTYLTSFNSGYASEFCFENCIVNTSLFSTDLSDSKCPCNI